VLRQLERLKLGVPQKMRLIQVAEYKQFLKENLSVPVENVQVKLVKDWKIQCYQPAKFSREEWTVWSFPERGDWATHIGDYRGNWSPYIPRNLIERYTKPGELVCDPMAGSGTTLVECKLLGRNGIGVDINPDAAMVTMNRLDFPCDRIGRDYNSPIIRVFAGDARNLDLLDNETVDLVATHPPYAGIVSYSSARIQGDLSALSITSFFDEIGLIARECFRVLKPQRYCAILIGDTRKHRHYIPMHLGVLGKFLDAGFLLKEDVIKLQHKTKSSRETWNGRNYDFYKIAHEHLYIFRKPTSGENVDQYKHSMKWW